ncbi:MAG: hypothetical protein FJX25_10880 [Alphaproteobacteria bacterium]|nr:hypothetical protein [Alphaproteobacteria bacterium]
MKSTFILGALLGLALWIGAHSPAQTQTTSRQNIPGMTVGGAIGRVEHGEREGGRMAVTVIFTAERRDYPGEILYEDLDPRDLARMIYLKIGDRDYPVWFEGGEPQIPSSLTLMPHDGVAEVAEVGRWHGEFVAPTPEMREIGLYLPNTGLIGPFPIHER